MVKVTGHTQGHILYVSIYMKYPESENLQRQRTDDYLPGVGSGRNEE